MNNGQLRVETGSRTRISYVRFDTASIGDAARVRLELVVGSDPGEGTLSVSRGDGGSWTADTLTSDNAPAAGEQLASLSGSFATGQQLEFDLPRDVVDGDVLDLVITHRRCRWRRRVLRRHRGRRRPEAHRRDDRHRPADNDPTDTTPSTTTPPTTTPPTGDPTTATVTFTGTDEVVANPERGFHDGVSVADSVNGSTTSVSQMESYFDDGIRLARMYVRLDDYRDRPIDTSLIANLDEVFANARAAGVKLIPRFAYNFGSGQDADVGQIEAHLDQLTPVLRSNADVIAALQAGFIGAWGEWHSSSNGLTNPTDRARVRAALLQALPSSRMVQFRYPDDLIEFDATPLDGSGAFDGSAQSRSGHKNDCFLANEHDAGTYFPLSEKDDLVAYLAVMTEFTVMGGETCQVSAGAQRTDCDTALTELELFHWDYLNLDFYGPTIDRWRTEGCFDEIDARLGYRFEMQAATAAQAVQPGGRLALELEVANDGFGKLYNPRPINVVLVDNATESTVRLVRVVDARHVMPMPGSTATLDLTVDVPSDVASGQYSIHVELPDGSPGLADDPRYSIRMANTGTWRSASGTNDLGLDVSIG